MARPLSYTPEVGPVVTLSDLRDFVAEAFSKGFPETAVIRFQPAIEVNVMHGPRAVRVTALPGEESPRD